jgi:hypothetical protein
MIIRFSPTHNMKQTPLLEVAETLGSLWQVHVPSAKNNTN